MKTILVTGASGFFGTSFLNALKKNTEQFKVFCIYLGQKGRVEDPRFTWIECDLLNVKSQQELIEALKPTHCIHFAWHVPPGMFWDSLKNIEWLYASANLFEFFCKVGGKVFVGAGSIAEYDWSSGVLDEESTPLNPSTLYGESKKSLCCMLKKIRDKGLYETAIIWPRIGYFFGDTEPAEKLMSRLVTAISRGSAMRLTSPDIKRPYAHVRHLGDILANLIFAVDEDFIFNLSASHSHSLGDIVENIATQLQKSTDTLLFNAYNSSVYEPEELIISNKRLVQKSFVFKEDVFFDDLKIFVRNMHGKI